MLYKNQQLKKRGQKYGQEFVFYLRQKNQKHICSHLWNLQMALQYDNVQI